MSLAGLRGEPSEKDVGGCQLNIFVGSGSEGIDPPPMDVSPDPPPPQPERNANIIMIKIEKSANGCLPEFAKMPSPNDLYGWQEVYHAGLVSFYRLTRKVRARKFQL